MFSFHPRRSRGHRVFLASADVGLAVEGVKVAAQSMLLFVVFRGDRWPVPRRSLSSLRHRPRSHLGHWSWSPASTGNLRVFLRHWPVSIAAAKRPSADSSSFQRPC